MNNFEEMQATIEKYIAKNGQHLRVTDSIKQLSYNDNEDTYLSNNESIGIDMDVITRKCYRKVIDSSSISENDSIKSVDCFLISKENNWFFVEFKDAKFSCDMKKAVSIKAYSNVMELLDILFNTKMDAEAYKKFDFDNPIGFLQQKVYYVLVYSSLKNPNEYQNEKNYRLIKQKYTPEFMKKLKGYLFNDVWAMSEFTFDNFFMNNFSYE